MLPRLSRATTRRQDWRVVDGGSSPASPAIPSACESEHRPGSCAAEWRKGHPLTISGQPCPRAQPENEPEPRTNAAARAKSGGGKKLLALLQSAGSDLDIAQTDMTRRRPSRRYKTRTPNEQHL